MKIKVVENLPQRGNWIFIAEVQNSGSQPMQILWRSSQGASGVSNFYDFRSMIRTLNQPELLVKTQELATTLTTFL